MNFLINLKEIKKNFLKKENVIYLILILIIFFLDRYSKLNVINNFNENIYYLNAFINLDLIWNTGVGFGLLSSTSNFIYNLITVLIGSIILILIFITFTSNKIEKIIFSLISGGALGNFFDRIYFKAVPDFIDLHFKNFHWFTFNIADIFITIGLIFMLAHAFINKKNEKN